jgi:multimeric flavodoxin WrbA|tara:strand:- start:471 stop:1370 length:900 start_codon:yes stop_codon:yes gene_type:complete
MKFLIVNGSLTPNEQSNTFTLCEMVKLAFEKLNHECEIVTVRDLNYTPSTKDIDDDMRTVINKMFKVDGVVFATPIWWGTQSSYIQSVIERMDFIDSWSIDNGYKPFYCKVFGTIVSGSGDGFQHIHGNCYNFASMLGFTTPPGCNIESAAQGRDKILGDEETIGMVKTFVTNMGVWAEALKVQKVKQQARHGVAYDLPESIVEGKRIPRKKGQPAKSKKHSDLYTDENPKGTIHGLGFKDDATARASVTKIRKSGRSHAHKIQAAVAMEQRAKAAGKTGPAAIYRKFINSMKKKTKAS